MTLRLVNSIKDSFEKLLEKINTCLSDDKSKKDYFVTYTIAFLIVAFFVFLTFIILNKSLVWEKDGLVQHLKAYIYYGEYLREIIENLIVKHKIIIPDWDFYISEGNDILTTLHYYVIGDPLTLLTVFIPSKYMHYFYSLLNVFRLYIAGFSFSLLCFGTNQKNKYGILAGSLSYAFCVWALINAARHPFFLIPMTLFPLMVLGIEKIIQGNKPYLFIVVSALSALSNFYFFYMIVLLSILYAFVRLGFLYSKNIIGGGYYYCEC